ncbi:uncharacterized protein GGS22DRAFT_114650 [Annulohypoxylon maeteangense]|uniref:uncharacterized protein n=1 Tax=Annulohypoxylon maeteangense TaxID=1927788 RepID=UPI0020085C1C|nr:uncharacterized protein GGS22DRAFT_114650 [Annulohypoxylon maeteangense]KAI0886527.1 hypothetical protein GGS22DRAFT_114650 [Annulohypoxylon maeteangense]
MNRFSSLPPELRLMIWRFAVDMAYESRPPCVWSLVYRAPYLSILLDGVPLPMTTEAVFQVNRESRHEAVSRYLLFKTRDSPKRMRVRADVDVFILDVGVLDEMACAPEWQSQSQSPHSIRNHHVVVWPPPLAAIYSQSWHNLAFVRKILLPSVCFTYLYRDQLAPLLGLPCLHTVYLDFGSPLRSAARDYAVKMFRAKVDLPGLARRTPGTTSTSSTSNTASTTRRDEFHAWYQEHSDLLVGPELKHTSGTDQMSELTKALFLKWQRIFLDDVLAGWEPFARKGVAGILVSELHYGLQTEI